MPGKLPGVTPRTLMKIEQIARMRVAGAVKDNRIAELFGLTQAGLARILATDEYREAEQAILTGMLTQMDEALAGKVKEMHSAFDVAVPAAMRALLETVTQNRDLRARMAAAKEILDRDPKRTFARTAQPDDADKVYDIPVVVLDQAVEDGNKVATDGMAKKFIQ